MSRWHNNLFLCSEWEVRIGKWGIGARRSKQESHHTKSHNSRSWWWEGNQKNMNRSKDKRLANLEKGHVEGQRLRAEESLMVTCQLRRPKEWESSIARRGAHDSKFPSGYRWETGPHLAHQVPEHQGLCLSVSLSLGLVLVTLLGVDTHSLWCHKKLCLGIGGESESDPYTEGDEGTKLNGWKCLGWDMINNSPDISIFQFA